MFSTLCSTIFEYCRLDYVLCLEICKCFPLNFSKTESLYNSYRIIHDLAFCLISHDFSLPHFAPSILSSWLFCSIANHSHASRPLHLLFSVLNPVSAQLILCLFMFLLKCYLLSEAFPHNPVYNCISPVPVSHVPHFPFLVLFLFIVVSIFWCTIYFILKTYLLNQNVSSYKNIIIHYCVFSAQNSGLNKYLLNDEWIRFMLMSIIIECQRSRDSLPGSFSESQHFLLALTSCCILMVYPLKL